MFTQKRYASWVVIFTVILSVSWLVNNSMANNENTYFKIDKGLFYLKEVFETVSRNYVDDLDPQVLSKSAIEGMLEEFDPYTVFFEDPGSQQMSMITRGKYGGVGMEIGYQDKKIMVVSPMDGTPAQRAGVRAGDIITKIDGVTLKSVNLEDISYKLRGKIGTKVGVQINRPGIDTPINFEFIREEIVLKDVTYKEFIAPGTAYVRLSAFSDKAGKEVKEAIKSLQAQQPIKSFILDLRGNPGGLLSSAVDVANIFLSAGQLIVSTRGVHERENKFFTKEPPLLPSEPLVILVNGSSASASEIVAGALQDLDRAVLVGNETFGKGLVQKVYPIDKISQAYLKITTAKYYVPSGRSIQKEDYKKNNLVFTDLSDSLEYDKKINYYTKNGRIVHGGGGIKPDIEIDSKEIDSYLNNLISRGFFFQFAVNYLNNHPELKTTGIVNVNDSMLTDFHEYVNLQKFNFDLEGEKQLLNFLEIAQKNKYSTDIKDLVTVAIQKLTLVKSNKFTLHEESIKNFLQSEFSDKLGGSTARIKARLSNDRQFEKAITVLKNLNQYQHILAVNK